MMVGVGATGPTGKRLSLAEIKSLTCIVCLCLAVCIHDKHTLADKRNSCKKAGGQFWQGIVSDTSRGVQHNDLWLTARGGCMAKFRSMDSHLLRYIGHGGIYPPLSSGAVSFEPCQDSGTLANMGTDVKFVPVE